jgi:Ribonucleotide reductase, alpha subunit
LEGVSAEQVMTATMRNLYDGISEKEVATALIISTRVMIDREPNYSQAAARMLMDSLRREALSFLEGQHTEATQHEMVELYAEVLKKTIQIGVKVERLADDLGRYDLAKLGAAIKPERDLQFTYLGLQTLYDRYFCITTGCVLSCRRYFSCAWQWAWPLTKSSAKTARLSFTTCCPALIL